MSLDMQLGHFGSLVQLGVALHAGAALFQLVPEFAFARLNRRISYIGLALEEIDKLSSGFNDAKEEYDGIMLAKRLFLVEYEAIYGKTLVASFVVAFVLLNLLIAISMVPELVISPTIGAIIVFCSTVPVIVILAIFDIEIRRRTSSIDARIDRWLADYLGE